MFGKIYSYSIYHLVFIVTILLTFVTLPDQNDAWWIRPRPVCPLGFVEVRGCVPLENMNNGAIKPFGGGNPQSPPRQQPQKRPPPTPPPPTTTEPTPPPCPPGYHGDLEGGWTCP